MKEFKNGDHKSDIKIICLFVYNFVMLFEWWPTQEYLTMFWLYTTYGGIKLLKSLYILDVSPIMFCRALVFF
jgi:hypothetical protein